MPLTAAQTTAFFTNATQMGIPQATVDGMGDEGISTVPDLLEFDDDTIKTMAKNLRTQELVLGAKSERRLTAAANLVRFYDTVGRELTAANLKWNEVGKHFEEQWKTLKEKKSNDDPEVPKITKTLPVIKWTESFPEFLGQVVGARMIPLSYVIREVVVPPANAPDLAPNQPHSEEHGSVEEELKARASHTHTLYREDNAKVFHYLEVATRSTVYASSIKPYQQKYDGRGAWFAIVGQYAGVDKWEAEIKKQEQFLHTRKWKATGHYTLDSFCSMHRNAYVSMTQCAEHVTFQLPNEHSRVGYLLEAIECNDAPLQAALASIRTDQSPEGMRNDFESAVAHMLPFDPVAKKRQHAYKRDGANISGVEEAGANISSTQAGKSGIGKTGVHLRYHKKAEWDKLTSEQKKLQEWRKGLPDDHPDKGKKRKNENQSGGKKGKLNNRQISSLIKTEIASAFKEFLDDVDEEEKKPPPKKKVTLASVLETSLKKAQASSVQVESPTKPPPVKLNSILKRAKNSSS